VPGEQFFANAYENWREDTAANSAVAVNACLSDLLEVSPGARRPLQQGKVAGVTSDTTNVMPATVRELSQIPFFEGCIWVLCGCHVMISHLLDQVKQVKAIKQLLALAKGVVDVFRIQAFCKIFLGHALPAEHSLTLRATSSAPSGCIWAFVFPSYTNVCVADSRTAPAATRACAFSSYAIMLESMLKYRHALVSAVLSDDFLVASSKAFKRRKDTDFVPPSEQVHEVPLAAEEELEQDGEHSFQRTTRDELCGQWACVYQAVLSEDFWLAAYVRTS
jgi:hypothetical protein